VDLFPVEIGPVLREINISNEVFSTQANCLSSNQEIRHELNLQERFLVWKYYAKFKELKNCFCALLAFII
jgi:hypothetical protein